MRGGHPPSAAGTSRTPRAPATAGTAGTTKSGIHSNVGREEESAVALTPVTKKAVWHNFVRKENRENSKCFKQVVPKEEQHGKACLALSTRTAFLALSCAATSPVSAGVHSRTAPDDVAMARVAVRVGAVSGSHATAVAHSAPTGNTSRPPPPPKRSHTRAQPSCPPLASQRPSEVAASARMLWVCPFRQTRHSRERAPNAVSQQST
jgi:hypothetical protein